MNSLINDIRSYPFERLRNLIQPKNALGEINLSIGEPKHNANPKILEEVNKQKNLFSHYPPMTMIPELKKSYKNYLENNFNLDSISDDEVFLVGGTREGTFSAIQTMVDRRNITAKPNVCMPNPYYQIYGGATLFAGASPYFLNCTYENNFQIDFEKIDPSVWQNCQLLVLCSPSNPTGKVMTKDELCLVVELSNKYDFKILSDECYIDIYFSEKPYSLLQAAMEVNRCFDNILVLHSLSKRSNLPGFRSGCATGDKKIISAYSKYRMFHGVSVPLPIQNASVLAWEDYETVEDNRALYKEKFKLAEKILEKDSLIPEGAFYLWLKVKDSEMFTKKLYNEEQVIVLPGKYLGTKNNGNNPAEQFLRIALVHDIKLTSKALKSIKKIIDND
jgi:N-succinyldiaminopimelate aminotransferase